MKSYFLIICQLFSRSTLCLLLVMFLLIFICFFLFLLCQKIPLFFHSNISSCSNFSFLLGFHSTYASVFSLIFYLFVCFSCHNLPCFFFPVIQAEFKNVMENVIKNKFGFICFGIKIFLKPILKGVLQKVQSKCIS